MKFKSRINIIRRNIMRSITKNIGSSYSEPKKGEIKISDIKKVLIFFKKIVKTKWNKILFPKEIPKTKINF